MCGIVGRIERSGVSRFDRLEAATSTLSHRGPDASGIFRRPPFFLGHRRLSIIDLSGGHQPLHSHDRQFVIVFNGEIYNYLELRDELSKLGACFRTQSDTEVIVEAYRYWGISALQKLRGMFAFALLDCRQEELLLARDRLGEKPLFYHEDTAGAVTFASELKALMTAGIGALDIDVDSLKDYLCLNYVPGTSTLIKGVCKLAPGHWRLYRRDAPTRSGTYWSPPDPAAPPLSFGRMQDARAELRSRLDEAVRMALRSDVPVALFLSGGIDSSLVAESAVRQGMISVAYCLDFEQSGFSEWPNAKRVADRLGLELRRAVAAPASLELFRRIVFHLDDPIADSSALAVWYLSERAALDYKVVITGDGGDELFAGYLTYQATHLYAALYKWLSPALLWGMSGLASMVRPSGGKVTLAYKLQRFARAAGLSPAVAHLTWGGTFLPERALCFLEPSLRRASATPLPLTSLLERQHLPDVPNLRQLQTVDATEYLPNDILAKIDRVTMAHGLESRAPLLAPEVAEFGLSLPDNFKVGATGQPKRILRALAEDMWGPGIGRAKKQGFSIPVHQWLRHEMREVLEETLDRRALQRMPFLDADAVERAKKSHLDNQAQLGFELWGLMTLSTWWGAISSGK